MIFAIYVIIFHKGLCINCEANSYITSYDKCSEENNIYPNPEGNYVKIYEGEI